MFIASSFDLDKLRMFTWHTHIFLHLTGRGLSSMSLASRFRMHTTIHINGKLTVISL